MTNDTAATATSISVIGSRNCDNATCHTDGGLSLVSELGPYCSRARGDLLRREAVPRVAAEDLGGFGHRQPVPVVTA